jgi:antibiotic biosynthesis monooxygenase (ABM) superfamily enzyme
MVAGGSTKPFTLVALLRVRAEALADFRAFEEQAARVMARHGGRIERALVLEPSGEPGVLKELHLVRFRSEADFESYRADAALAAALPLRERSVIGTEIWQAEDVAYGGTV